MKWEKIDTNGVRKEEKRWNPLAIGWVWTWSHSVGLPVTAIRFALLRSDATQDMSNSGMNDFLQCKVLITFAVSMRTSATVKMMSRTFGTKKQLSPSRFFLLIFLLFRVSPKNEKYVHFKGIRLKHDSNMYDVSIWIWNLQFVFVSFFLAFNLDFFSLDFSHFIISLSTYFSNINPTYKFFFRFFVKKIANLFISQ